MAADINPDRTPATLSMSIALPPGTTRLRLSTSGDDAPEQACPIEDAPQEPDTSILLFCPEQGGWHVGEWWPNDRPRWVAVIDADIELEPTHWQPAPPYPRA
jgi:hypothetical protein